MRIFSVLTTIVLFIGTLSGQTGTMQSVDIPFIWGQEWASGARALGLGGAYSAIADGQSAILYNPAGLGRIQRTEVYATFSQMGYSSEVNSLQNVTEENTNFTGLNDLGLSVPMPTIRGSLVFGFGYHRIRQFDASLMISRFANHFSQYDSQQVDYNNLIDGSLSLTSFGGSMEVAPDLYMGLSFNIWGGSREYNNRFTFTDINNIYYWSRFDSTDHSKTSFSGLNFTLGMLYQINKIGTFSATIKTPVTLKSKEDWDYADIRDWEENPEDPSLDFTRQYEAEDYGQFEYKIRSPWVFRFGGSLTKGPVTASADIEMIDYSQIQYKTDTPFTDTDKASANIIIRRELRNIKNIYLGGELSVPNTPLKLRGGYSILENPIQNASTNKQYIWSLGAGYNFSEQFGLNAAFARTNWDGPTGDLIDAEKIITNKILVTMGFYF